MGYWGFQADPRRYEMLRALRDLDETTWLVTRYADQILVGDKVLLWQSGENAGGYALAEVTEEARLQPEDGPSAAFWTADQETSEPARMAKLRVTERFFAAPLLRVAALDDALLSQMLIIRQPAGTNFPITEEQFVRAEQILRADRGPWTREELILALATYRGIADGSLSETSAEVSLARLIGRTEGSLDWVLASFKALEGNADEQGSVRPSQSQREIWDDFATLDEELKAAAHQIESKLLRGGGLLTPAKSTPQPALDVAHASAGGAKYPRLPSSRRRAALDVLSANRLRELVDELEIEVDDYRVRDQLIAGLADGRRHEFGSLLQRLTRDELKHICGQLRLDDGGKEKVVLVDRILASGSAEMSVEVADAGKLSPSQKRELLSGLKAERLRDLVDELKLEADSYRDRASLIAALADGRRLPFGAVLDRLTRPELKELCSVFALDDSGTDKAGLVARLLDGPKEAPAPASPSDYDGGSSRGTVSSSKKRMLLETLRADRLRELVRQFRIEVSGYRGRDELVSVLADGRRLDFAMLLNELTRDELKEMSSVLGVTRVSGKDKRELLEQLLANASRERPQTMDDDDEDQPTAEAVAEKVVRISGGAITIDDVSCNWPATGALNGASGAQRVSLYLRQVGGSSRGRPWERRFQNPAAKGARVIREPGDGSAPLLLGLWDEQGDERAVIVAMDPYRRLNQDTRVSLFVPLDVLERAADAGTASHTSGSGEIVSAVKLKELALHIDTLTIHREKRGSVTSSSENNVAAGQRSLLGFTQVQTSKTLAQILREHASEPVRYSDGSVRFVCQISGSNAGPREPWLHVEWGESRQEPIHDAQLNLQHPFIRKHLSETTAPILIEMAVATVYAEYRARTTVEGAALLRHFANNFLRYMAVRDGGMDDTDDD